MNDLEPSSVKEKKIPAFVSIAVILLCVAAGGYLLWSFWAGGSSDGGTVVGADDPPSAAHRADPRRILAQADRLNAPDGVTERNNRIAIKAGTYQAIVTKLPKGDPGFYLTPINQGDFISPEQMELIMLRRRIFEKAVAEHLKLTPEQVAKIKKVPAGGGGMILSKEDQQALAGAWKNYEAAQGQDKPAAEKKLAELVKEVADRSAEPTKKSVAERTEAMKAILSQEQIDLFHSMGK